MAGKINAALENPLSENIAALLDDESLVFYVDWREDDEDIVWSCVHLLQNCALSAEFDGDALFIRCGEKRVRVPLLGTPADRHITVLALNEALSPHDEIRFCRDSNGSDTLTFAVFSRAFWRELEDKYGAEVEKRFSVIVEKPNLFTDAFESSERMAMRPDDETQSRVLAAPVLFFAAVCGKIKLMEHRQKEWSELQAQAMYLLEHPHLLPEQKSLDKFHLALRLWHYPAFESHTVWLLYRGARDDTSCSLSEVVWNSPDDAERMLNPLEGLKRGFHTAPTFRTRTIEVARNEIDKRLDELQHLSLPAFINSNTFGLDGDTFGIAVGTGFLNAQVSWWCDGPQEWQQVIKWFNHMKAYLVAQLEKN